MHDQVHNLSEKGLKAEYLGSSQPDKGVESRVLSQHSDTRTQILFVTPEWLYTGNKMSLLQQLTLQGRIGLIAIDEAHLIFDWQTFRSKYARIESIKQDFPSIPLWFSQLQPLQKFYST